MATSVKHAVPGFLVILLSGFVSACCKCPPDLVVHTLPLGCPPNAAPSDTTQLRACLTTLAFDTVAAVGDEQRLLVRDTLLPGDTMPACSFGDAHHKCRHGPLAKIEPVLVSTYL